MGTLVGVLPQQEPGRDPAASEGDSLGKRYLGDGLCDSVLIWGFGCPDVPALPQNKQRQTTAFLCHPGLIWHFELCF